MTSIRLLKGTDQKYARRLLFLSEVARILAEYWGRLIHSRAAISRPPLMSHGEKYNGVVNGNFIPSFRNDVHCAALRSTAAIFSFRSLKRDRSGQFNRRDVLFRYFVRRTTAVKSTVVKSTVVKKGNVRQTA